MALKLVKNQKQDHSETNPFPEERNRSKGHHRGLSPIKKECNICGKFFRSNSVFVRYCLECKKDSALYQFHDTPVHSSYRSIKENINGPGKILQINDESA